MKSIRQIIKEALQRYCKSNGFNEEDWNKVASGSIEGIKIRYLGRKDGNYPPYAFSEKNVGREYIISCTSGCTLHIEGMPPSMLNDGYLFELVE